MSDGNNDDKADKIAAIKARLAKMKAGGDDASATPGTAAAPAPEAGGDKASQIAAIKARLAGGIAATAPGAGVAADAGGSAAPAQAPAGDDMAARIAALKAKVDSAKGAAAPAARSTAAPARKPAARGAKNVYPVQPVNRTTFGDERLYGDNTLNLWFILGGLALTVAVLAMWDRDHDRDWKPYQEEFRRLKIERLRSAEAAADAAIDKQVEGSVEQRLSAAQADVAAHQAELEELEQQKLELEGRYYGANQAFQISKASMDEMRFAYEEQRLLHGGDAQLMADEDAALAAIQDEVASKLAAADKAKQQQHDVDARIKTLTAGVTQARRELDDLLAERQTLAASLAKIEPGIFNDYVRNMPMADMLAPTLKVKKIVLDKLRDNYNFMHVGKVDMCITCHVSINDPDFSDWDPANEKPWHVIQGDDVVEDPGRTGQRVFDAHPRLDLFVGDDSPHPMGKFGCTTCHMGRGQALEFPRTFHTPTADAWETVAEKTERWEAEYDYDPERHYWDWPMTPSDMLYSSCYMCHSERDRLDGVPEYNRSRELVENLGCYGCHKIQGLEHLRKPGPDLTRVATKLTPEWSRKWALSPQGFRPTTRMPHFWHQSNTGAPASATINPEREWRNNVDRSVDDWRRRNEVEARAVLAYIFELSRQAVEVEHFELKPVPQVAGDPERGKQLFKQRGCLGCHSLKAEGWEENWRGPELSSIGSKVGPQWLYNWILDPKRYFPTTVMPNLRLPSDEAWDITAFLLPHRDEQWEALPDAAEDGEIVDQIAVESLSATGGEAWAIQRVAEMRAEGGGRAVELYAGEKLFGRYGCAGCHLVPGHYDDVGIGTELTHEGLKELSKFDFGHEAAHGNPEAIQHSLPGFFERKLKDPRVFDRLPVIGRNEQGERAVLYYEQKVKLPGEKLKMPNFYLDDGEIHLVTQFLLGLRDDGIDATMKEHLDDDAALVEAGSRLITKLNCIGCHRVGQFSHRLEIEGTTPDDKLDSLESITEEGLEYGLWMAHPMTSGDVTLFDKGEWLSDEFYWPEAEEDTDIFDFFLDEADRYPIPDHVDVFGADEGRIGKYIEDGAMRPPVLRQEGAKVQPDWLFDFLLKPHTVRTHVETRMPTFGLTEHESLALVRWFAHAAEQPWPFEPSADGAVDQALYDQGDDLFNNSFQCNKCHPAGDQLPSNPDRLNWGPDLGMARQRLKPSWIHAWLLDPYSFQPGTKMPTFFGESVDGEYESYYDDYQQRIDSLVEYMRHVKGGGAD